MLSSAEINDLSRQRAWILVPAATVGGLAILGYFAVVAFVRDPLVDGTREHLGHTAAELMPCALILSSLAFCLTPLVWAEQKAKRFALLCPRCAANLTRSTNRVLATRCCCPCGVRIVEGGRVRTREVFARYSRAEQRRCLVYWFWVWPALGAVVLVHHTANPSALANCIQMLLVPGLIGTAAASWAFARTRDRRYLPQLGAAAMVFSMGAAMFWKAFW